MNNFKKDKIIEQNRYSSKAENFLSKNILYDDHFNSQHIVFKEPYKKYYEIIRFRIKNNMNVLEIGSGFGEHTEIILKTNCSLTVSDISESCLNLLKIKFSKSYKNSTYVLADIEDLPFKNNQFDAVCSAGVLSYGKPNVVYNEIKRVLKPNGYFICVDSLNNNLIYKLNRYINYLIGSRSLSTIRHMPDIKKIQELKKNMNLKSITFFGVVIWTTPLIKFLLSDRLILIINNFFDKIKFLNKYAFKFVILLQKAKS